MSKRETARIINTLPNGTEFTTKQIQFIRENSKLIRWARISTNWNPLSLEFLTEFQDQINWNALSNNYYDRLSIDIIKSFKSRFNWKTLSRRIILPQDLIREFKNELDWINISRKPNPDMTEDFIEEMQDYICWKYIHEQNLSKEFVFKYRKKLNLVKIIRRNNFSREFIETLLKDKRRKDYKNLLSHDFDINTKICNKCKTKAIYSYKCQNYLSHDIQDGICIKCNSNWEGEFRRFSCEEKIMEKVLQ